AATSPTAACVKQPLLALAREDVLAAADDHVLQSTLDTTVAAIVHRREVAGVEPSAAVDRGGGGGGHLVIAMHDEVATRAQLTNDAAGNRLAGGWVDDPHLGLRERAPDRRGTILQAVVEAALRDHRRALGLAVGDRDTHAEPALDEHDQ